MASQMHRSDLGPEAEYHEFDFAIVRRHHNHICEIDLLLSRSELRELASAMQVQFPALRHLKLLSGIENFRYPALPDGFLGGSAPRLQSLELDAIPFPALPKFLLSATDLVDLRLWNIPHYTYISPEAMLTCLAVLANLKSLTIEFELPPSLNTELRNPPLPTHIVLPALTHFDFRGFGEYVEELVVRIDAPLLDSICIVISSLFDAPELAQFIRRTTRFRVLDLNEAHVDFDFYGMLVDSLPSTQASDEKPRLRISCNSRDWDPSFLAMFLDSLFPSFCIVKHLYIHGSEQSEAEMEWEESEDDIEDTRWLEIFYPFTTVKKLYVCKTFAQFIAPALQQLVGETTTHVLPALECLLLEEPHPSVPVQEAFGQFIAARQLFGHPVAVSLGDGKCYNINFDECPPHSIPCLAFIYSPPLLTPSPSPSPEALQYSTSSSIFVYITVTLSI
jgi:hypothetical protein